MNNNIIFKSVLWLFSCLLCLYVGIFTNSSVAAEIPELSAWMIDKTGTLSESQQANLNTLLENHEKQTSEQFIVLMIPTLDGESIEEYAVKVFEKWQLGQKDKDNGLLVVIAKNDRKLRIEVGYGLEGKITDAISGRIIRDDIAPYFKSNDYYGGISHGINQLLAISNNTSNILIDEQQPISSKELKDLFNKTSMLSFILVFLLPLSFYIYVRFYLKKKIPYLFVLLALAFMLPNVVIYYIATHALAFIQGVTIPTEKASFNYFFKEIFSGYLMSAFLVFIYYIIYQILKRIILTILSIILSQDLVEKYSPSPKTSSSRSSSYSRSGSSSSRSSRPSGGGGRSGGGGASGGW